jgi:cytochrome c oxidase cbb3-type subunit 4
MLSQGMKFFTDTPLTLFAMILFMMAFLGITVWTFFRSHSKEHYQKLAKQPLLEEPSHE